MTTPDDPRWDPTTPNPAPGAGQPAQPQPQYGPPPQQDFGAPQWAAPPPEPVKSRGRGKAVAIGAAAVVVLGGGIATYAAVSSGSGAGGSATPTAAVQKLFRDMNNSDLLGMLDDLPPGERDALVKPFQDSVDQLERIGVLKPGTDLSHISGIDIQASRLTFAPQAVTINDHLRIVKLTGGRLHVDADAAQLPLAGNLLHALEAHASGPTQLHHTVDIGAAVRKQGQPIRIATQQVDGRWYPSLLYTIADNATTQAGLGTPNPAEAIPARGASSPDQAVRGLITHLLAGRVEQAIELTSPDEDAVLHDYGKFLVDRVHYRPAPVHLNSITFTDTAISGGTQVSLKSISVTSGGQRATVSINGKCVEFKGMGQDRRLCRGELAGILGTAVMPAAQRRMLAHLSSGVGNLGVVTTQTGGKWFVNPLRSVLDIGPALLSGLTAGDLQALMHGGVLGASMDGVGGSNGGGGGMATVVPSAVMSPTR